MQYASREPVHTHLLQLAGMQDQMFHTPLLWQRSETREPAHGPLLEVTQRQ